MPRSRFHKLPAEKRERILRIAAKEFGMHSYKEASLNRMLEQAGISKGAAYYYFDDKADLYRAVVEYYISQLTPETQFELTHLSAENFWPTLAEIYRHQTLQLRANPWMLGISRTVTSAPGELLRGSLAETFQHLRGWLDAMIRRGQELGSIRQDLPVDLLLTLMLAVDSAMDQWLSEQLENLDEQGWERHARMQIDSVRRLLVPPAINPRATSG